MPTEILSYKGKPILKLTSTENTYTKLFIGIKKAKLIISEVESIKEFILNNPQDIEAPKEAQEVKP